MKNWIWVFCMITSLSGLAQDSPIGNWINYFGNKKFESGFNWHHEAQYRNYNLIGDLEQLLLRIGLGYNLSDDNNNVLLGYGFIHSENYLSHDTKASTDEHRIFQQFIHFQSMNRGFLQHRIRVEERYIGSKFRMRYRYFLGANIPLNHQSMEQGTYYLSAYNELFMNSREKYFDRNRVYMGLGHKFNQLIKIEVAYMTQVFSTDTRDQINLCAFVSF